MSLINFNFRIDQLYKDKLDIIRGYYQKYFANSSDLLRHLVDGAIDQKLAEERTFPPDLRVIGQKVDEKLPLNHEEIRCLALYANLAYKGNVPPAIFNPAYVIDNLAAFFALLPYLALTPEERDVCWGNFPPFEQEGILAPAKLQEAFFNAHRAHLEARCYNPDFVTRNLSYLAHLDRFLEVNILLVNQLLEPFKKSLLILAKKHVLRSTQKPAFHCVDHPLFRQKAFGEAISAAHACYSVANVKVSILKSLQFSSRIVFTDASGAAIFELSLTFPEIYDVLKLCALFSQEASAKSLNTEPKDVRGESLKGEYFSLSADQGRYCLRSHHGFSVHLAAAEFIALQEALAQAREDQAQAIHMLIQQWGDF